LGIVYIRITNMSSTEQQQVQSVLRDKGIGNGHGKKLVFDPGTGKIHTSSSSDPDGSNLQITGQDLGFSS
jgi:hypothetical protein